MRTLAQIKSALRYQGFKQLFQFTHAYLRAKTWPDRGSITKRILVLAVVVGGFSSLILWIGTASPWTWTHLTGLAFLCLVYFSNMVAEMEDQTEQKRLWKLMEEFQIQPCGVTNQPTLLNRFDRFLIERTLTPHAQAKRRAAELDWRFRRSNPGHSSRPRF